MYVLARVYITMCLCVNVCMYASRTLSGKVQFNDVVESVRQEVQKLKNEGVKIIIAVGHAGFTVDKLVGEIDGVDIVIGGHTNTFLYTGK